MKKLIITDSTIKLNDVSRKIEDERNGKLKLIAILNKGIPENLFLLRIEGFAYNEVEYIGSFPEEFIKMVNSHITPTYNPMEYKGEKPMAQKLTETEYHELKAVEFNGDIEVKSMTVKHPYLKYFKYDHLPERLQEISKQFYELAHDMDQRDIDNTEKTVGLRKLLEAKDCFVRGGL